MVPIVSRPLVLERLRTALFPPQRPSPWWESGVLVVLGAVLAFFRIGSVPLRGVLWAEDGSVYLTDAHAQGLAGSLFDPYAGYPQVAQRLLTSLAVQVPVAAQGVAICLLAALALGAVGCFVHHVVLAHSGSRVASVLALVAVCACPVGPETVVNLANLQWYLMPAAILAPFWRPGTQPALVATSVVMAAYVLSSPFGAGPVGLALAAFAVTRTRAAAALAGTATISLVVAVVVMVTAPERGQAAGSGFSPSLTARGYLARVVGDGVLGVARHDVQPSLELGAALAVVALVLGLVGLLAYQHARLAFPVLVLGLSAVVWTGVMWLSRVDPAHPFNGGRYAVAPTILFLVAVALLIGAGLERVGPWSSWVTRAGAAVVVVLLGCLAYGISSSYLVPDAYGRGQGPSWTSEVDRSRDLCETTGAEVAQLAISPATWTAAIPCEELTDR